MPSGIERLATAGSLNPISLTALMVKVRISQEVVCSGNGRVIFKSLSAVGNWSSRR